MLLVCYDYLNGSDYLSLFFELFEDLVGIISIRFEKNTSCYIILITYNKILIYLKKFMIFMKLYKII